MRQTTTTTTNVLGLARTTPAKVLALAALLTLSLHRDGHDVEKLFDAPHRRDRRVADVTK